MIARTFGVSCSRRSELFLAFAYLRCPEKLVSFSYHLVDDFDLSALSLARRLQELPVKSAELLAVCTLRMAGFEIGGRALPLTQEEQVCSSHFRDENTARGSNV